MTATLAIWLVTLPMTLPFVVASGMAADAGDHWHVEVFIWSAFTYPCSVIMAFLFRRNRPKLVFLPCVNIAIWLLSGYF